MQVNYYQENTRWDDILVNTEKFQPHSDYQTLTLSFKLLFH